MNENKIFSASGKGPVDTCPDVRSGMVSYPLMFLVAPRERRAKKLEIGFFAHSF